MDTLTQLEVVERIVVALVLGAALGYERERSNKPAGLRTYALVAEGAALFMIGSILLGEQVRATGDPYDPSRIASTVVQGIGFLAGGAILSAGGKIMGLTTAAGIWVTAAVGLLVGAGFYVAAIAATVATFIVLSALGWLEYRLRPEDEGPGYDVADGEESEKQGG